MNRTAHRSTRCFLLLLFVIGTANEKLLAQEPVQPVSFKHAGIVKAWKTYANRLTFGKGQTLALVDDGCTLSKPEWSTPVNGTAKVLVTYDSVDGDDNRKQEGRGYHGSTIGVPSSLNYGGKWGVAYNNQLAVIRALECCHCNVSDGKTMAAALQWIIENHKQYRITTVNLAPVDDLEHDKPVPTAIDEKLAILRKLGIWVSAPTGNHKFAKGISWPASQPNCFAIGAVKPGRDQVHLDRHAKVELVVPAHATSSSNAIVCGSAMLLREAIFQTSYDWKADGPNLAEAMMAIMQKTGVTVDDPASGRRFQRLDLEAALAHVFAKESLRFSEHLLADKYGYTFGVAAADLDGDGDLDLTNADIHVGKKASTLYWFENNGQGDFERHVIHQNEPGWFERQTIGDINRDGRPDVAIVNNKEGQLVWFANREQPADGPWKRHVISLNCPRAYDVALADFDGDGDLDAASSGYASNLIAWYENPGKEQGQAEWVRRVIDAEMPESRTMRVGDFNSDGKIDLLATAIGKKNLPANLPAGTNHGSQVVWYENSGQPANKGWTKHIIDNQTRAPVHGHPTDMDGDGDLDVLMACGMRTGANPRIDQHQILWYENVSQPKKAVAWKRHQVGRLPFAFEAIASDLDGDNDLDVVASSWSKGDRVVWFENRGNGQWALHVLRENFYADNQVSAAVLDGYKRPDIVSTSDDGSRRVQGSLEMRWWRNLGRPASK